MILRIWIWRISLVLLVVFMSMGFYRLSLNAFRSFFAAQVIETPYTYPSFQVFQKEVSSGKTLLTLTLQPYDSFVENPAPPEDLYFLLEGSDQTYRSEDQQRINGYPFIQIPLENPSSFELRLFHQLGTDILLVKTVSMSEVLALSGTLKGSALPTELPVSMRESFQPWHLLAIVILVMLGVLYLSLRYQSLLSQGP